MKAKLVFTSDVDDVMNSLSQTSMRNKQDENECLREALSRVREELDQQKRLNKAMSQRKVRLTLFTPRI